MIKEYIPSLKGNYRTFYDGVFDAIRNEAAPPVSAEEGLKVIRIIEAAIESNKQKKIVTFQE
jgi:predicted dehydrogenase